MNGFVDAVGEDDLVALEAEVLCDDALDGLALGIDGHALGGELLQLAQDGRAGAEGVLVEVEAEGVATGERGVILGHGEYRLARLYGLGLFYDCTHRILTRTLSA